MYRYLSLLPFIGLSFWSCEEEVLLDTTPPSVSIQSPNTNQFVNEVVTIIVETNDNEGVKKVEFYINDSLFFTDIESPYQYNWNTTQYEDYSEHIVKVISYDNSDNSTTSQPIVCVINNSTSTPNGGDIFSVTYTFTEMTVEWEPSLDGDFKNYKILYSTSEIGDKDTLETYMEKSTTSHTITEFDPLIENWFWVQVTDTLGLNSIGIGKTNDIDSPPTISILDPIILENGSFVISWSQNNDSDFKSYTLYESESEDMSSSMEVYSTEEVTDTIKTLTGIGGTIRYYQLVSRDHWGLESNSGIKKGNGFTRFFKTLTIFGSGYENSYSVQQAEDSGYIIAGSTDLYANGDYNLWLVKTDSQGNEEWGQTYGGSDYDVGESVQQTGDGGYIITGRTESYGNGASDVWLVKTDSQGQEEWSQTFGEGNNDYGNSVQQTGDGGYIITGGTEYWTGASGVLLIKTDSQGNEEWSQTFGAGDYTFGNSVQQTEDGGYVITGVWLDSRIWLIKTDGQGNEITNSLLGGSDSGVGNSVQQTEDGGYIIAGSTQSYGNGGSDIYLIKAGGQILIEEWNQTFGGNDDDHGKSVQQTEDGGYIIAGSTQSYGNGGSDVWLIKTDSQGQVEWDQTFGGGNDEYGYSVQQTEDGGYIITGHTLSPGGYSDVLLIKTDLEGNNEGF